MIRIFSLLFFINLLIVNLYSYTKSDLLNKIRWGLRDNIQDTIKPRWSDEILTNICNEAQKEISDITWCMHSSTMITTIAATTSYTLPDDLYAIQRIIISSVSILGEILPEKTITLLDQEDEYWFIASTGIPISYYWTWNRKIGLNPCPDTSYNLDIDYIQRCPDLVNDTDIPFNNSKKLYYYHELIVWYVIAYCMTVENKQQAQTFWTLWSNGVVRMGNQIGHSPNNVQFFGGKSE